MCRMRAHAEFIHIGFSNHYCPLILKKLHYRRIVGAGKVPQYSRGRCSLEVFCADVVFDRDRFVSDLRAWSAWAGVIGACDEDRWIN